MSKLSPSQLRTRMRRVKMVIFDVDGVLTDGKIYLDNRGVETKAFNVADGAGIKYLHRVGIKTVLISGRSARANTLRARELGIVEVHQKAHRKIDLLPDILSRHRLAAGDVCYLADDLTDLPLLRAVGLAVAVADARPEVRRAAHCVTRARGGEGAARELAEKLIKAQGKWRRIMARYE